MVPFVWRAWRNRSGLEPGDLPRRTGVREQSAGIGQRLEAIWREECERARRLGRPGSLCRVLFRAHARWLLCASLLSLLAELVCKTLSAYSVGQMLLCLDRRGQAKLEHREPPPPLQPRGSLRLDATNLHLSANHFELANSTEFQVQLQEQGQLDPEGQFAGFLIKWALWLILSSFAWGLSAHFYGFQMMRLALHARLGCSHLIYAKALKLPVGPAAAAEAAPAAPGKSPQNESQANVFNLVSNDLDKFNHVFLFLPFAYIGPLQTALTLYLLWPQLGVACLGPLAALCLLIPGQLYLSRVFARARAKITRLADQRLRLLAETIGALRLIKFYAWEPARQLKLDRARALETDQINRVALIRGASAAFMFVSSKLLLFVTLFCHCFLLGRPLEASTLFMSMALLNNVQLTMSQLIPRMLILAADCLVSVRRIERFLNLETGAGGGKAAGQLQLEPQFKESTVTSIECCRLALCPNLGAQAAQAESQQQEATAESGTFYLIRELTFKCERNRAAPNYNITLVCGPSGSGKSSLLLGLLGELRIGSGWARIKYTIDRNDDDHDHDQEDKDKSTPVGRPPRIAYCSQEAWLFDGTIRENIVFGRAFDAGHYARVLEACALEQDLRSLGGDLAYIQAGSLSGGQRARVNLARCLYEARGDIYLLDDPLAALDSRVAQHIIERAFGQLLAGKLVLLVNHNKVGQLLALTSELLVLGSRGRQVAFGRLSEPGQLLAELERELEESPCEPAANYMRQIYELCLREVEGRRPRASMAEGPPRPEGDLQMPDCCPISSGRSDDASQRGTTTTQDGQPPSSNGPRRGDSVIAAAGFTELQANEASQRANLTETSSQASQIGKEERLLINVSGQEGPRGSAHVRDEIYRRDCSLLFACKKQTTDKDGESGQDAAGNGNLDRDLDQYGGRQPADETIGKRRSFAKIWFTYYTFGARYGQFSLVLLTFLATQLLFSSIDVYLTVWSSIEQNKSLLEQITAQSWLSALNGGKQTGGHIRHVYDGDANNNNNRNQSHNHNHINYYLLFDKQLRLQLQLQLQLQQEQSNNPKPANVNGGADARPHQHLNSAASDLIGAWHSAVASILKQSFDDDNNNNSSPRSLSASDIEKSPQTQTTVFFTFNEPNSDYAINLDSAITMQSDQMLSVNPIYRPMYWLASRHFNSRLELTLVYALLLSLVFIFSALANIQSHLASNKSGKLLYKRLTDAALFAKIEFFDRTPNGRFLNRASRDISIIDEAIPYNANQAYEILLQTMATFVLIILVQTQLTLASVCLLCLCLLIYRAHVKAAKDIHRYEAILRSPIIGHLNSTLAGLTTIRATQGQVHQMNLFRKHQDSHSACFLLYLGSNRLIAVALDCLNSLYLSIIATWIIFGGSDVSGPSAGLILTSTMLLSGLTQHGLMKLAETESLMTSVERVIEYCKLPQEGNQQHFAASRNKQTQTRIVGEDGGSISSACGATWPQSGKLEYKQVDLYYNTNNNHASSGLVESAEEAAANSKRWLIGDSGICNCLKKIAISCRRIWYCCSDNTKNNNSDCNNGRAGGDTFTSTIDDPHPDEHGKASNKLKAIQAKATSGKRTVKTNNNNNNCKPVLKNITFKLDGGEKVGIIGRTGAGKSSVITTLFRLYDYEGSIEFDGLDIRDLELFKLRSSIGIIPQQPVLFTGSIRENLDPFQKYDDSHIWLALDKAHLRELICSLPGKLDYFIIGDSDSSQQQVFSLGQKQLISLARVLLKQSKLVVLDEATANVDPKTDSLIQATIRREFKYATLLTIAHRLETILDSDRIMILDSGRIIEFDTPERLLARGNNYFSGLMLTTQQKREQINDNTATTNTTTTSHNIDSIN